MEQPFCHGVGLDWLKLEQMVPSKRGVKRLGGPDNGRNVGPRWVTFLGKHGTKFGEKSPLNHRKCGPKKLVQTF